MTRIIKGIAFRLDAVVEIDGFRAYILEDCSTNFKAPYRIDLGKRRILKICRDGAFLILESNKELIIRKLEQKEIKLIDYLRDKGIKCRTVANYSKGQYTGYCPMWKHALNGSDAIFSENGYALQNRIWADCREYFFNLVILKPGWLKIGGEDISLIRADHILDDLLYEKEDFITRVLTGQTDITEEEYHRNMAGLG